MEAQGVGVQYTIHCSIIREVTTTRGIAHIKPITPLTLKDSIGLRMNMVPTEWVT